MSYERYEHIFKNMGDTLQDKFIDKYHLNGYKLDLRERIEFDNAMQMFIADNKNHPVLQRMCSFFPELKDVPHPDEIIYNDFYTPTVREIMKNAYIEKIEWENFELKNELDELKNELVELRKRINGTTDEPNELEYPLAEPVINMAQPVDDTQNVDIPLSIYRKFFGKSKAQNRYQLLDKKEIEWINRNVDLSDENSYFLDILRVILGTYYS